MGQEWIKQDDNGGKRWYTQDNEKLGALSIFCDGRGKYTIRKDFSEKEREPILAGPFPNLKSAQAAYLLICAARRAY
jgi:hypothetical protein